MQAPNFKRSVNVAILEALRDVHTIKPGVVTKVSGGRVNVKPVTQTAWKDGTRIGVPELLDVPLFIYSANLGKASVTVPVKVGDPVLVLMSDRDYGDMMDQKIRRTEYVTEDITPLGLNPIAAIPSFYTNPQDVPIDTDNIVISNEGSTITVSPAGDISIHTEGNYKVEAAKKLAIGQEGGDEVLDLVSQLLGLLEQATTMTIFGPQKLDVALSGQITTLKTKLDAIKGTL